MDEQLRAAALEYHRQPTAGKISITPTKELVNQHDLALAYSPGVAAACDAILDNPREAQSLTSRGNLVAVITNGTAVHREVRAADPARYRFRADQHQ